MGQQSINIKPLSLFERFATNAVKPLMYLLQGTFKEDPQQTHRWNNHHLDCSIFKVLENDKVVYCRELQESIKRGSQWSLPLFHLPIFGGWREYVVLEPTVPTDIWYIGWKSDRCGISRIPLHSRVRMLLGDSNVSFIAFDTHGRQIALQKVGEGTIGQGGPYAQLPLL